MSDFFEQKQKSLIHFRQNINKFIKESKTLGLHDQLDTDTIQDLLGAMKNPLANNGKVNSEALFNMLRGQQGGNLMNRATFNSIFGSKKEIRISDLGAILKRYELDSFDFESEAKKHLFARDSEFKIQNFNSLMKELGWAELNKKNKEILIECFDFNNNKKITAEQFAHFIQMLHEQPPQKKEAVVVAADLPKTDV